MGGKCRSLAMGLGGCGCWAGLACRVQSAVRVVVRAVSLRRPSRGEQLGGGVSLSVHVSYQDQDYA